MKVTFRPIDEWPADVKRRYQPSPFKNPPWSSTLRLVERELRMLGAKQVVIQIAISESDLRVTDGMPKGNAVAGHPGVILAFESKHGPLKYTAGEYSRWQDNLRAIALGLESLRRVDRYGITQRGEQYKGWRELPETTGDGVGQLARGRQLIQEHGSVNAAFRATHPDHGGDPDDFMAVNAARAEL